MATAQLAVLPTSLHNDRRSIGGKRFPAGRVVQSEWKANRTKPKAGSSTDSSDTKTDPSEPLRRGSSIVVPVNGDLTVKPPSGTAESSRPASYASAAKRAEAAEKPTLNSYFRVYIDRQLFSTIPKGRSKYVHLLNKVVVVRGIIGVGKTTTIADLVAFLISQGIPAIGIEESFNDDLMALFYKYLKLGGKNPYSFTVQMDMLSRRMRAYDRAMLYTGKFRGQDKGSCPELAGPGGYVVVADGDLDTDALFAAKQMHDGNFTPEECKVYLSTATQAPRYPIEHIIQLYVPSAVAHERVKKRGRPFEKDMEESYLADLDRGYAGYAHEQLTTGRACVTVLDNSDRLPAEYMLDRALQTPDAATLQTMYRQYRGIPEQDRTGPWGEDETGASLVQFYSQCVFQSQ